MSKTKRKIIRWLIFLAVVGAGGGYLWYSGLYQKVPGLGSKADTGLMALRFHTVHRGRLEVGLTEGGQLRAVKNYAITSTLKGTAKIAWLVSEGAQVQKGDRVVEFETKPTLDAIRAKEADLETARRQQVVAEENLKIEKSSGQSLVAAAQTRLSQASVSLKRFVQLDAPKRFKDMEAQANTARKNIDDATKNLADARTRLDEEQSGDETQRATMEKQVVTAQESLRLAKKSLATLGVEQKMYKGYDYPRDLDDRRQAVANAQLDLEKAKVAAKSQLLQKEAELGRVKDQITRLTKDLTDLRKEVDKSILPAPVDGMVLYGDASEGMSRYYYSGRGPAETKVGADVWPGQTILTIPDLSAFEIDIAIGEEYRSKVKKGCRAIVTIEAISGLVIEGTLKTLSSLAQARNPYDSGGPKAFTGVIELTNGDSRMVSGMSAKVEIVANVLESVLRVPLEAVYNEDGKPVCYVRNGSRFERRLVRTGQSNDDFVHISYGLEEGESVCLFRPPNNDVTDSTKPPPPPLTQPSSAPATGLVPTTKPLPTTKSASVWHRFTTCACTG